MNHSHLCVCVCVCVCVCACVCGVGGGGGKVSLVGVNYVRGNNKCHDLCMTCMIKPLSVRLRQEVATYIILVRQTCSTKLTKVSHASRYLHAYIHAHKYAKAHRFSYIEDITLTLCYAPVDRAP